MNIEDDKDEDVEENTGRENDSEEDKSEEESESEADAVDSHSDLESDDGSMEKTSAGEEQKKINEGSKNKLQSKEQNAKKKAASLELPYTFAGKRKSSCSNAFCRRTGYLLDVLNYTSPNN